MNNKLKIFFILILIISLSSGCTSKVDPLIKVEEILEESIVFIEDKSPQITEVIEVPKKIEDRIEEISIVAVGDLMFHIPQVKSAYLGNKEYDFTPTFKHIKKYIESADIALANYETVTLNTEPYTGFPRFNSPKETMSAIAETGFDIISTANNHSLDRGKKGIISTLDAIDEYSLKSIGTYRIPTEEVLIEDIKGIKIGFLSYTYSLNGLDSLLTKEELGYMINIIDEEKIKADIEKTKELGADLTVLFLHWGHEYHSEPSNYQIELGKKIIDWGGNIIFGSHPHIIQKSEIMENPKENYIIYSMGNFLSNQNKELVGNSLTEDGVIVKLNIEKNFTTGETSIKEIKYIPTWVYKYRAEGKLKLEIVPVEEVINGDLKIELTKTQFNRIEESLKSTLDTIIGK